MPKQTRSTSTEPAEASAERPPLPDLTGIDLRTLRVCQDSALTGAARHLLRCPAGFTRMWSAGDGGNGGDTKPR